MAWKDLNLLPVSPYSPKILMKTSASVPAPMTSPVYTLTSYLLPGNEDRESVSSFWSWEKKNRGLKVATTPSTLLSSSTWIVTITVNNWARLKSPCLVSSGHCWTLLIWACRAQIRGRGDFCFHLLTCCLGMHESIQMQLAHQHISPGYWNDSSWAQCLYAIFANLFSTLRHIIKIHWRKLIMQIKTKFIYKLSRP